VKIAGDKRLGGDAATGADHFNRKSLIAVIAFFDGDELVHVAAGNGGDGESDFFLRVDRFSGKNTRAEQRRYDYQESIHEHTEGSENAVRHS
jgi:hypothetical protein